MAPHSSAASQSARTMAENSACRSHVALACTRVSGNPEGNQRVPSTLRFRKFPGKSEGVWSSILFLSNFPRETREFPESESWSGAKSEGKLRKSANYPGIFQVYPQNTGGLPILLTLAQKQTRLRAQKNNDDFHGVSSTKNPAQSQRSHGRGPVPFYPSRSREVSVFIYFPEETRGCCRETSRKHGKETR